MDVLLLALIFLPASVLAAGGTWDPHFISCDGSPDGYHEAGCWGKAVCVNGQPVVTQCADDQMFDYASDSCVSRSLMLASTSCNTPVDCSKMTSGRHADLGDGCTTYYICLHGVFIGRSYCPPDLVFNEALQVCDYPAHSPPPCGIHTGGYSATPAGPWETYRPTLVG